MKKGLQIKRVVGVGGGALNGEVCMTKRSHNEAALWCRVKGRAAQKKMSALRGKFAQEFYVT